MNVIERLMETGQKRSEWLNQMDIRLTGALRRYRGPTGIPDKLEGVAGLLEYSDAGDYKAAAEASRNLVNNPSVGAVGDYASSAAALAMPFLGYKLMTDGVDAATDMARGARDGRVLGSNLGNVADDAA